MIAIEGDYTGPKLDSNEKVTVEFTEQLIETYKEQQKLHRRYAYQVFYFIHIIIFFVCYSLLVIKHSSVLFGMFSPESCAPVI